MIFIPIEQVEAGMTLAEDVFVFYSPHVALIKKGQLLTPRFVSRLQSLDIPGIYVREGNEEERAPPRPVIGDALRRKALDNIQTVFEEAQRPGGDAGAGLLRLDEMVFSLVDNILMNRDVLVNIADLKSYDDYTYHHSLSVCLLSLATGTEMGFGRERLHTLGMSSILHDIGKVCIPIEIISKPSRLTDEEYRTVQQHPQLGGTYLLERSLADGDVYRGVVSHHEHVDGTGYPKGLKQSKIPLDSRIICVADVYDALTSHRPYRDPVPCSEAVEYLMGGCGSLFDMEVVDHFLRRLTVYPIGSFVELSSGQKGVVIRNDNQLRPVVRVAEGRGEILDLGGDFHLRDVVITHSYRESDMRFISSSHPSAPLSDSPGSSFIKGRDG